VNVGDHRDPVLLARYRIEQDLPHLPALLILTCPADAIPEVAQLSQEILLRQPG